MLFTELRSDDDTDTPVEELFPDDRSENLPEQVIDQEETTRLLREILDELPEDQRAAIGMFYYEELSVKEIAAAMNVSESAVKSRLMYGRNKIEKKVRELEKQGTKLYGLSPLPFLLLLFRSQKASAAAVPSSRILQAVLSSQPMGAATAAGTAKGIDTTGATAGAKTAGAAGAGTAATAGGLGALKIGLIAFAAVSLVGLGAFGATRIASPSAKPQEEQKIMEDDIDKEEAEEPEELEERKESEKPEASEEQNEPEELDPIDAALEQYRIIIGQADSYDYGQSEYETSQPERESVYYCYALVQTQPDDPVPTLVLERSVIGTEITAYSSYDLFFQYDPETKTVHHPTEVIAGGGIHGGLVVDEIGGRVLHYEWSETGEGSVARITLDGDSLNRDVLWTGHVTQMGNVPEIQQNTIDIILYGIENLSALDSWTAPSGPEI